MFSLVLGTVLLILVTIPCGRCGCCPHRLLSCVQERELRLRKAWATHPQLHSRAVGTAKLDQFDEAVHNPKRWNVIAL